MSVYDVRQLMWNCEANETSYIYFDKTS